MSDRHAARFAIALAAVALACTAAQAKEPRAVTLLRDHKCYVCHADDEPGAGPAFADIAAHYRGNPDAVGVVAAFVRRGAHGSGPWHMPPHPEISAVQAKAMARYIVSLDAKRPQTDQPAATTSPRS